MVGKTGGDLGELRGTETAGHLKRDTAGLPVDGKVTLTNKSAHIELRPEKTKEGEKSKVASQGGGKEKVASQGGGS